jgi:hypothetical protein
MRFRLHPRADWGIRWVVLIACAAVAGTALKVYQWYFSRPLWLDEQMVLLNVRDRAIRDLMGPLWMDQAAPLGWLVLQRGVVTMIGTSDRDVRALPVLFGIGTLWAAWWMARHSMKPLAAAIFVMLCGISQWMTFYALEAKPYSADAFCALILLAFGIWAGEGTKERPVNLPRIFLWWAIASVAQWVSFAATLITPACAAALFAIAWRRAGWRAAAGVAVQGLIWLVSFGAHYTLSIGVASNDPYLRNYWAPGFPPNDGGVAGAVRWLMSQGEPLASHPAGTRLWIPFWLTVAYGVAAMLVKRPVIGLMILSMPVSGFLLALFRVMPFTDRLALWTTPPLYAALAIAAGDAFERNDRPRSVREWVGFGAAIVCAVGAWAVCLDIFERGRQNVIIRGANHDLDDRRGVRLLMNQREPGDVFLTAHLGLPAVWWYGQISTAEPNRGRAFPGDGAPLWEISHRQFGVDRCRADAPLTALSKALAGAPRASVYLGFDSNNPPGFQQLVLDDLAQLGTRVFYSRVASEGVSAIYDFRQPPDAPGPRIYKLTGCVAVQPAKRW